MQYTRKVNIYEIFAFYQQKDFFYQNIPVKTLSFIDKKINIPFEETVIAFLKYRSIGPFKSGICFTEKGLYWEFWGRGKGSLSWEDIKKVNDIKIKKDYLYIDKKRVLDLVGTLYPQNLLLKLLEDIKQHSIDHPEFFTTEGRENNHTPIKMDDVLRICNTFNGNEECWMCQVFNVNVKTANSLSVKTKKSLLMKNNFGENNALIGFVNTYMGVGTNGIIITEKGVYFSDQVISSYYPWPIFKEIQIVLDNEKKLLQVDDHNVMNLSCSVTDENDILLFLHQLQRL